VIGSPGVRVGRFDAEKRVGQDAVEAERAMPIIRSGCGQGSGASKTALTSEKMAVLAPMPSARAVTATVVNPGLLVKTRREWHRSERRLLILILVRATFLEVRTKWGGYKEDRLSGRACLLARA